MPVNKVQQVLKDLEDAGAIVRASSFVAGKAQRRIWPSTKIIPPVVGGIHPPTTTGLIPPTAGGEIQ